MAAVELPIFNDLTRRKLVTSAKDQSEFVLPDFFHQDNVSFLFTFLKVSPDGNRISAPYSKVDISGAAFTLKLFNEAGDEVLASQDTWAKDNAAKTLAGALDLNTAEMADAFSNPATKEITAILEGQLDDGKAITSFQVRNLKIRREYNTAASGAPTATDTYYTKAQIDALFAKKLGAAGDTITLTSPDGTKSRILGVRNDGDAQDDII